MACLRSLTGSGKILFREPGEEQPDQRKNAKEPDNLTIISGARLPAISNVALNFVALIFAKNFSGVYRNGCDHNSHTGSSENCLVMWQDVV